MRRTALVTGASSGIGRELAFVCAREGCDLVLSARSKDRLDGLARELKERFEVKTRVVASDLTDSNNVRRLHSEISEAGTPVDVLINNAGFGTQGAFAAARVDSQLDMLRLNVEALTHLTRLFLPSMLDRQKGWILNVASTAAFQPGPFMAVYYATKAYVLSFSEALAEEVRDQGVTVTALCPGPTATEFQARAEMQRARLAQLHLMDAGRVAEEGYRGMMKGKIIVTTGLLNRLLAQSVRMMPRVVVRRITRMLNQDH